MTYNSPSPHGLTFRQCQAMSALVRLFTTKKIAAELRIDPKNVDRLIREAMKKLGATSRIEAALLWDRMKVKPIAFAGAQPANSVFALGNRA